MTASDKIEEAKNCFKGISESGKNNFQKFTYFETKDIFPVVRKVCKQFHLKTKFNWDTETNVMTLTVTDRDDNSNETYNLPVAVPNDAKAGNYMQSIGSIQTYAMRYLYIQCFEITVPDEIDNRDQNKKQAKSTKYTKVQKNVQTPKQINHSKDVGANEEITEQDVKELLNMIDILFREQNINATQEQYEFQIRRKTKNKKLQQAALNMLKLRTVEEMKK